MKELFQKNFPRSLIVGLVFSAFGYFRGWICYPFDDSTVFPPAWAQILRIFVIYALIFLIVNVIADYIAQRVKRHKRK